MERRDQPIGQAPHRRQEAGERRRDFVERCVGETERVPNAGIRAVETNAADGAIDITRSSGQRRGSSCRRSGWTSTGASGATGLNLPRSPAQRLRS